MADDGTYADTYYITDGPGNPLMVIPPEATKALKGGGNASEDAPIVENYCYIYRYDEQMRMISRHIPGRAAECFAYDCEGRPAYSRDGNLAAQGRRAFTLYDPLGRVAVTGTCADVTDESWWRTPSSTHPAMTARRDDAAFSGYRMGVGLQQMKILTVNYYDDYSFASGDTALMGNRSADARPLPMGLLTGTRTAVITPDGAGSGGLDGLSGDYLLTVSYYDAEERIIESRAQTLGGGLLTLSTAYTAGGVPKQTRTVLSAGTADGLTAAGIPLTFTNDITVDRHGRPVTSTLTAGGSGAAGGCLTWNLGSYGYNGVGRLASVVAQGAMRRNTYYDIHGWVTQWQTPYLSQRLIYGPEPGAAGATPSYTGLITAKITTSGDSERRYNYSYDGLGRLTSAAFTGSIPGADYSTSYTYDLQGNMLRLMRKGLTGPGSWGTVDDVTATYSGNQLHTMRDDAEEVFLEASLDVAAGSYGNDAFDYDANGNLSRDMSRGIAEMEYNLLNLPQRVTFADGSQIDWVYTAAGQKLRQTVIAATGDTLSRRDYIGPYHFTNGCFDRYQLPQGYVTADSVLHAYIPDYQGNIVGVVNTATDTLEQLTDYYPYGLPHADASNPMANRNLFCGNFMEPSIGVNQSDFIMRHYLPSMASFVTPDPLCGLAPDVSPYLYCFGDPINYADPWGLYGTRMEAEDESRRLYDDAPVLFDRKQNKYFISLTNNYVEDGNVVVSCRREYGFEWRPTEILERVHSDVINPIEQYSPGMTGLQVANDAKLQLIEHVATTQLGVDITGMKKSKAVSTALGKEVGAYYKVFKHVSRGLNTVSYGTAFVDIANSFAQNDGKVPNHTLRLVVNVGASILMRAGPIGFIAGATILIIDSVYGDKLYGLE